MYYIIYFTRRLLEILEKCMFTSVYVCVYIYVYTHTETDALINQAMITSTLERNTQPIMVHCIK